MKRRTFIHNSLLAGAVVSVYPYVKPGSLNLPAGKKMMKRILGRTGEKLSIVGFGGIVVKDTEQSVANNYVSEAVEAGINYFDVAPSYGNAEEMLGPALEPFRKDSFLACKTHKYDAVGAEKELHESMKKLRTDYFDLYQLHALSSVEDVEKCFGPGGAMEVFLKAKESGKVRFLGFSAHSDKAALLAMKNYDFDTILFPLNYVCWHQGNFGPEVVKMAKEKEMGILALKGLAHTLIPENENRPYERLWYVPIEEDNLGHMSLRYTLSLGTTAAIPPGDFRFFKKGLEIGLNYTDITEDEKRKLVEMSEGIIPLFESDLKA